MYIYERNHNPNKIVIFSFLFGLSVGNEILNFNNDGGKWLVGKGIMNLGPVFISMN